MRLAIRVDASARIGIGHVKRCLALATAICAKGAGDVLFVTRALGSTAEQLRSAGYAVEVLPVPKEDELPASEITVPPHLAWAGVEQAVDAAETIERISSWCPDWVLVDHYAFDSQWQDTLRAATGTRLAAIDDLADRSLSVDLLVDHNICADHHAKYVGRLPLNVRLLGGPAFALVDPVYAGAPRYKFKPKVRSVGVFMGGADASDITPLALRACRDGGFVGHIEVVSTTANPHLARLRAACVGWAQAELSIDLPDLTGFFARHDLQIGAAGGASWERCCIGAPSLLVTVAANQIPVATGLGNHGAAIVLTHDELREESMRQAIRETIDDSSLRLRLSNTAQRLVDGCGAVRVALELAAI
jgi:UDP-2,4-diacetamido-2,4,6-trideoxy-beta-L-altropyranose hydrolase